MKLVPKNIPIGVIMLDPENPRFEARTSLLHQNQLINILVDESDAGTKLFRSMQKDIKWVNRIVVKGIEHLSKEFIDKYPETTKYDFIVVEGNTRLACLNHKDMTNFTETTEIPVLVAEKETHESMDDYNKELRMVQGIANVTVVQDWSQISKARHIYNIYKDNLKKTKNPNVITISNNIALELGIPADEVRQAIRRFAIFLEVASWAKAVPPKDWPYFEVFDLNDDIRSAIGLVTKGKFEFEWDKYQDDDEDIEDDVIYKKELLMKIPEIIESAKTENLSSKDLRKPFRIFMNDNKDKSPEELKNELIDTILKSDKPRPWESIMAGSAKASKDNEVLWKKDITYFAQIIESYPVIAKWSKKYTKPLSDIRDTINRLLEILEK